MSGYDITQDPAYVCLPRGEFEWLRACYWSPMSGMRDVAADLMVEWGHRPEDYPEVVDALEIKLSGALIETASDVMREHGLPDLRVQPEGAPTDPVQKCPDTPANSVQKETTCRYRPKR